MGHVTTRAKIWTGVKRTVGVVIALTHAVGGNFAMISNQDSWNDSDGKTIAAFAIIANHIKDLDFTLSATQSLVGHTVHDASAVETHWENFTQKAYPLKYIRKMKKQLESIQDPSKPWE